MERGTTGASASQNHVAGIITTLGATWRTHGDGRIIFPRAPPWRARGYPVPAMLFGGEARAAVNLPSSLRGPLRPLPPSLSVPLNRCLRRVSQIPGQGRHMAKRDASLPRPPFSSQTNSPLVEIHSTCSEITGTKDFTFESLNLKEQREE